jgi:hypothetical protein
MKLLILFVSFILISIKIASASDLSCQYTDASIVVDNCDKECRSKDNGNETCKFNIKHNVMSECEKDVEIFYSCQVFIEYSPDGLFSQSIRTSTNAVGSVVAHAGKGNGTVNVLWDSIIPVKNVKVTKVNCYPTDTYPIDEQK